MGTSTTRGSMTCRLSLQFAEVDQLILPLLEDDRNAHALQSQGLGFSKLQTFVWEAERIAEVVVADHCSDALGHQTRYLLRCVERGIDDVHAVPCFQGSEQLNPLTPVPHDSN
jgi:hypothetical protein